MYYDDSPSMSYEAAGPEPVAMLGDHARQEFIGRTYSHLLGAILGFVALEMLFFQTGIADAIFQFALSTSWLVFLGGFMVVGFIASRFAHGCESIGGQYMGLFLYVLAEAVIFAPLLFIANMHAPGVIETAAAVTVVGFVALTAIVFVTRRDFSFMRGVLMWASFCALAFIVAAVLFGFTGGILFPLLMIVLAGGWILHDTSNVLHHFPEDRYVGAALELFASVALMFWYVIILFMRAEQ